MEGRPDAKKHRKFKKKTKLLKTIQDQLEFYFGDSNLHKDRFLQKKIQEHPEGYVPIEVIASFNKMKSLTQDRTLIVKAMKNSSLLEVSADEQLVRRTTPLSELSNVDERTLYVENLPLDFTHETLKATFKKYGTVTYVSIPRFKNKLVKGFAFVEFSSAEEANDALKDFVPLTCKEETLSSSSEAVQVEGSRKRKRGEMEVEGAKKPKLEEDSKDTTTASDTIRKDTGPLRVISKVEWIKLKEMYKQLQKKQMSQLKEAMKEKKDTKKKSKQDITTEHHEDATHDAPLPPVSGSHDPATMSTSITVEITMCSLTASDLESMCKNCGDVEAFQFDEESKIGQVRFKESSSAQKLLISAKEDELCCSVKSSFSKKKQKKRKRRGREKISTKVLKQEAAQRIHITFDSSDNDSS
ncbi:la-related protein 7-like [Dysidea avara]|uniref:la-related protein 7-like n=1 Tax=Dysidea avara TaxID=196820 RepID=UPI0033222EAA